MQKAEFAVIVYFSNYWGVPDVIHVYEVDSIEVAQNFNDFNPRDPWAVRSLIGPSAGVCASEKTSHKVGFTKLQARDVFL